MGFLLSKLLPLALYPLGLALLLQLAAQAARGWRWSGWLSAAGIALLWVFAMPITSRQLIWGLEEQAAALTPTQIPQADAVVVLGGGLKPALPPRRSVEVAEAGDRLLTAVRLLRQGRAPLLLTNGGQVSFTEGDPALPEALSARDLAVELGVPAGQILLNPAALDACAAGDQCFPHAPIPGHLPASDETERDSGRLRLPAAEPRRLRPPHDCQHPAGSDS
jgi:uncharacterized SAM-binding protein YcdF (DUF218 family)